MSYKQYRVLIRTEIIHEIKVKARTEYEARVKAAKKHDNGESEIRNDEDEGEIFDVKLIKS